MATAVKSFPLVLGHPVHRTADHRAGGAAEQEPASGQTVAGADGVRLLDAYDLVHIALVEQRRSDAGAEAGNHPASWRTTEGLRANGVYGDDPHRPVPLPEVARAAHQGSGSAGADEQHVQFREPASDCRRGRAVVRLPVLRIGCTG